MRVVISGSHALISSDPVSTLSEASGLVFHEFWRIHKWREQFPAAHSALAPSTGSAEESIQSCLQQLKRFFRWRLHMARNCSTTLLSSRIYWRSRLLPFHEGFGRRSLRNRFGKWQRTCTYAF